MDLIPQQKIERFLKFRPAVRVIYYHILPDGQLRILLGKHKVNGQLTIPGGRVEKKDIEGYDTIANAMWHVTMFREIREELLIDDMGIINAMITRRFIELGAVFWKHHKNNQVCVDFLGAIECDEMFEQNPALNNELEDFQWVDYFEVEPTLFMNVGLAIEMLYSRIKPTWGPEIGELNYNELEFSIDELRQIINSLNEVLV